VFYQYGKESHPSYQNLHRPLLDKLKHLLIDEFQDISPLISKFLNELKRQLNQNQIIKSGSLMTIGDENQSVYGWRGSSPSQILNFESCFSLAHDKDEFLLENNFRCKKPILDQGDYILSKISEGSKSKKKIFPAHPESESGDIFYKFHCPVGPDKNSKVDFELAITELEKETSKSNISEDNPVYLLCTSKRLVETNDKSGLMARWCKKIEKLKSQGLLKVLTIHSSKGLEGYTVFIVGDVREPTEHPVRELLCKFAGMGSYYAMQREEQLRLAYVGVTRAKCRLHWFAESLKPERNLLSEMFPREYIHEPSDTI